MMQSQAEEAMIRTRLLYALAAIILVLAASAPAEEWLASRPRPKVPSPLTVNVGDDINTASGERRHVRLRGGATLYIDQNTHVQIDPKDQLSIRSGRVYLETSADSGRVAVQAGKQTIRTSNGKIAIGIADGVDVGVLQGQAEVTALAKALTAGQQWHEGDKKPKLGAGSHLVDWVRDTITLESPLVPASPHAGGALVAIDPDGQAATLTLRKQHIDVYIEDGFARTTIDQTYFNERAIRLEGTFYFPLPPDASLSRLAMYVDGKLMEGGMAERDYARSVYETIRYQQRDPALLEWVDGSTFKMRVFPLEPREEKRILLSYTQRLPGAHGRRDYRFPAGHSLPKVRDWSFGARIRRGADLPWTCPSHSLKATKGGDDLILTAFARDVTPTTDVVLHLHDSASTQPSSEEAVRFSSAEHDGSRYLMLRYRHAMTDEPAEVGKRCWVVLFESSGDRDALLGRAQIEVIRGVLSQAEPGDTFAVLAAGTRTGAFAPSPQPITPENVERALAFLGKSHLIGALDLGRALSDAAALCKDNAVILHVGSGVPAMGERRIDVLAKRIPGNTAYVGIGVGRRWNRDFMKAAAERTGGFVTQINPDEPIAWRAIELASTLRSPRLLDLQVTAPGSEESFRVFERTLAQGEELAAIIRIDEQTELPEEVKITGLLNDRHFERTIKVRNVTPNAGYLPRTWAKLEIERLLTEDAQKHKPRIIALSKAMYVMTPFTSLLVLENEDMYQQFKVDRGRQDHWAPYPTPLTIPVVYEPDPSLPDSGRRRPGERPTPREVRESIVVRLTPSFPNRSEFGPPILSKLPYVNRLREDPFENFVGFFHSGSQPVSSGPTVPLYAGFPDPEVAKQAPRDDYRSRVRLREAREELVLRGLNDTDDERPPAKVGQIIIVGNSVDRDGVVLRQLPVEKNLQRLRIFDDGPTLDIHRPVPFPDDDTLARFRIKERLRARGAIAQEDLFLEGITRDLERMQDYEGYRGRNTKATAAPYPDLLYQRPSYTGEERFFFDLVTYCPGMDTSEADIRAAIEAEAEVDPRSLPGKIDPAARRLIDRARAAGSRTYTLPASASRGVVDITFDNSGRFVYERVIPPGLREIVACDGKTLLHLYPDLGIGARRVVSRFHRQEFASLVPWAVPPAEDLARGADLRPVGERVVEIVPHGPAGQRCIHTHLLFTVAGDLAERRIVLMPENHTLATWLYDADGTIRTLNSKGKEVAVLKGRLAPARALDIRAEPKDAVILSLPYRKMDHVRKTLKLENKRLQDLRFDEARALFASAVAAGNGNDANAIFRAALHARNERHIGYYVLLAACGQNLDADNGDVLSEYAESPLGQYLALFSSPVLRKHASQWAVGTGQWKEGYLHHLASTHALLQRWRADQKGVAYRPADFERGLEYVRRNKGNVFAWALLCRMQDAAGSDAANHRLLVDAWLGFFDVPGLGYAARYERARSHLKSGQHAEGRKGFRALFEGEFAQQRLPALDTDFRKALVGGGKDADAWAEVMQEASRHLIKTKRRGAVLTLARQCVQLGDPLMADRLLDEVLAKLKGEEHRLVLTLAAIQFCIDTGRLPRADQLFDTLRENARWTKEPELWRLGARIADLRGRKARKLEFLERGLELEFAQLPDVIDAEQMRKEYGLLLEHYQNLAEALVALKQAPPADFVPRVIRTADRWRALDPDGDSACRAAAEVLQVLGRRDLSWEYLTTPLGRRPNEAEPWQRLATQLVQRADHDLADQAYRAACESEPTNAELLWDRAENLMRIGKATEARALWKQIADGDWQPRFRAVQTQARSRLE
jgi:ferric-dicitrate binding protein FerR (iron transport regulator)